MPLQQALFHGALRRGKRDEQEFRCQRFLRVKGRQRRLLMGWEVIVMLGECAGPDGISRDGREF